MVKIKCSRLFKKVFIEDLIAREECPFDHDTTFCKETINEHPCLEENIEWEVDENKDSDLDRRTPLEIECDKKFKDFFFSYMEKYEECPFVWNKEVTCDIYNNMTGIPSLDLPLTEKELIICNNCLEKNIKWRINND